MNKVLIFLNKERLYILILIFVILFNIIMFLYPEKGIKSKKAKKYIMPILMKRETEF